LDISHLDRSITSNEIEVVIKSLLIMKSPGSERFTAELFQTFKEELTSMFLKLFHKIEKDKILLTSFYKASITLTPKFDNSTTKKQN
jgi:hypothetical protein